MNVKDVKNRYFRAFTMPEVALAVGVVAFGLVAVFSVLLVFFTNKIGIFR